MTYRPRRIYLSPRHQRARAKRPRAIFTARPNRDEWQEQKEELSHAILMEDPIYKAAFAIGRKIRSIFLVLVSIVVETVKFLFEVIKVLPEFIAAVIQLAWFAFIAFGIFIVFRVLTS
jgi:hypothetical protein